MNRTLSKTLRKLLMALMAIGLLGLPVLAQDDAEEPESPVEVPAPAPEDPAEDEPAQEEPAQEEPAEGQDPDADETADVDQDAMDNLDDQDDPGAQDNQTQDGASALPAPAVGTSRVVDVPVEAGMRDFSESAWVRVINLSPNVGSVNFNLVPTNVDAEQPAAPDFMQNVEYQGHGTYVEMPAGSYEFNVRGTEDGGQEIDLGSGRFYTLAVIGLELPPEAEADQQEEGGFMGWLRGVFGGDDGTDAYTLDVLLLEDDLFQTTLDNESLVRVVNAAPGTEEVTLAVAGESGTLTGSVAYGDSTGTNRVNAAEFSGPLELRLGGSRAATIALEDVTFTPGTVNTVFLVGTPIEEAPLHAIVLSTPAFGDNF